MALIKVIVPQIMPGIVSGALIAFTMSFDDFIISYFVTGKGIKNLSIMVYTMSKRVNPSINAISTLIVIFITIVLILVNVVPVIREKRKVQTTELKEKNKAPRIIAGIVAACVCMGLVFVQKQLLRLKNMQDKLYMSIMPGSIRVKICFLILKNKRDAK